jgi:RNA polymerase sigma factor (sigma-70 family)
MGKKKIEHKFIDDIEYKYCYKCNEYKIIKLFTKNKNYWDGFGAECLDCRRKYNQEHKKERNEYQKQWNIKNKDKINKKQREYYEKNKKVLNKKKKEYLNTGNNREKHNERVRDCRNKNLEKHKNYSRLKKQQRRAIKKILPNTLTQKEWETCIEFFSNNNVLYCAYCGEVINNPHQDHIIPMANGGGYTKGNIIPTCQSCNCKKHTSNMEEWYEQQDFFNQERLNKIYEWVDICLIEDQYALPIIKFKNYKNIKSDIKDLYDNYILTYKNIHKYNNILRENLEDINDDKQVEYKSLCFSIEKDIIDILINLEEYLPINNKFKIYKLIKDKDYKIAESTICNIEDDIINKVLKNELYNIFKNILTKKQYVQFYLYYINNYNQEKIGKLLNVTQETVSSSLKISIKKILKSKYLNNIKKYLVELTN